MKNLAILLISTALLIGCSSVKRTKFSDKNMRIMVDPHSLDSNNLMKLQTSLVSTDKWTVVDRHLGFRAIRQEQERLHRYDQDRYDDKNKFAHWGKLYGVGAVVTASIQCRREAPWWNTVRQQRVCRQYINLVDANTGEVVLGVSHEEFTGSYNGYPEWDEVVEKMGEVYPKYFTKKKIHDRLKRYQKESLKHAKDQQVSASKPQGTFEHLKGMNEDFASYANSQMMHGHRNMESDLDKEIRKQGLEISIQKP